MNGACRVGVPWALSLSMVHKGWGSEGPSLHLWHTWSGGPLFLNSIHGTPGVGVPGTLSPSKVCLQQGGRYQGPHFHQWYAQSGVSWGSLLRR